MGLSSCGNDLWSGDGNRVAWESREGKRVRAGRQDWSWEELGRVPGGDRGVEEGRKTKSS